MKQKSLTKNTIYNFLYTGLNLFFPLITSPYVSRVLGAESLGRVQFANSIVQWFLLFAVFGTTQYGIREVAKTRENERELGKLFSELISITTFFSFIAAIVYFFLIFTVPEFSKDKILYFIMSLSIGLNMFNIDWFYQGMEEYRYITIRSTIFKVLSLISIFLFIHSSDDYFIYALITVLSTSLSGVLNFIYSRNFVKFSFKNINPIRHVKSLLIFFTSTLVINSYSNLDKTLLGFIATPSAVAFMARGTTITNMGVSIAKSISNATLPRASYYIGKDKESFTNLMNLVPKLILWITLPMTVGIIILSSNIMYILGGPEFLEATLLLQIVAGIIVFSSLSTYIQTQIILPTGNERIGLYCALLASAVSISLNFLLIPKMSYLGSGIAVLAAEFTSLISRYVIVKTKLGYTDYSLFNKSTMTYALASLIMGSVVFIVKMVVGDYFLGFILGALIGALVYILVLLLVKEEITNSVLKRILRKIKFSN